MSIKQSPENEESSNTCQTCQREVFGRCEECFTPSTMIAMADASRGLNTTSWDDWNEQRLKEDQNHQDQDDNQEQL
jgi:hypothetical protein